MNLDDLDEVFSSFPDQSDVRLKVLKHLSDSVGQTDLSLVSTSKALSLSKRTLQRRLENAGTSFAELRDVVRRHYALKFLYEDKLSVAKISELLDFSDRTSFTSACKRWTDQSPSQIRKGLRMRGLEMTTNLDVKTGLRSAGFQLN